MPRTTTYFNAYNCRPTYAWQAETSGSTTIISGSSGSVTFDDTVVFTAGETIIPRDLIFIKSDGLAYRAHALDGAIISASFEIGFAVSGALSGATFPADTRQGKVLDGFSGLSVGSRYFIAESPGGISTTEPPSSGSVVYQVGIAKTSQDLVFKPQLLVRKFDP
jgi:hypothetical protein